MRRELSEQLAILMARRVADLPVELHERLATHSSVLVRQAWAVRSDIPDHLVGRLLASDPSHGVLATLIQNSAVSIDTVTTCCGRGQRGTVATLMCALRGDQENPTSVLSHVPASKRAGHALVSAFHYWIQAGELADNDKECRLSAPAADHIAANLDPVNFCDWAKYLFNADEPLGDINSVADAVTRSVPRVSFYSLLALFTAIPPHPEIVAAVRAGLERRDAGAFAAGDRGPENEAAAVVALFTTWLVPVEAPAPSSHLDVDLARAIIENRSDPRFILPYATTAFGTEHHNVCGYVASQPSVSSATFAAAVDGANDEVAHISWTRPSWTPEDAAAKAAALRHAFYTRFDVANARWTSYPERSAWDRLTNTALIGTPCDGTPIVAAVLGTDAEALIVELLGNYTTMSLAEVFTTTADILTDVAVPDATCPCGTRCARAGRDPDFF